MSFVKKGPRQRGDYSDCQLTEEQKRAFLNWNIDFEPEYIQSIDFGHGDSSKVTNRRLQKGWHY